jgi:hypothetical protein
MAYQPRKSNGITCTLQAGTKINTLGGKLIG